MWIIFATLNPFAEALRNLFSKKASLNGTDPLLISWANNIIPILVFSPLLFIIEFTITPQYISALAVTGSINIFAVILYMKAISEGDISIVVPMLSFTPMFMLITSPLIVGEFPKIQGLIGIILIVTGSYLLNINLRKGSMIAPFKALIKNKGTRYMLMVAFIWSISSNYDKIAIRNSSVYQHILLVNIFIFSGITLIAALAGKIQFQQIICQRKNLLLVSLFTTLAYVFHMTALSLTLVAYVVTLKRASGIFSVILGHFILNEKNIKERILGSILMLCGVLFIVFS